MADEHGDSVLATAVKLKFPTFQSDDGARKRVELLEEHIWATAAMRADLHELRLQAYTRMKLADDEMKNVPWHQYLSSKDKGKEGELRAKRQAAPDKMILIEDADWTVKRCTEEIDRMNRDYDSASRAYTLASGG